MVCSAWFRERLRKASLKKENDVVQDIDIKSKRILLFDFDGTLIETASGNTFATDLTDMRIKMDVVNKALDLMQENGVKVFAIVSNQGGVEAGFVSGADIEAKIEYVLRCVHDLAVKRGIRGVLYEKRLCYSNDEQNPMRKPNTGMIDDILTKCKDTVMRGMNFSQLKGCSLMVGDASGLPGQFSDSDKVCAENAGIDYMDVTRFVGKDLDLNLYSHIMKVKNTAIVYHKSDLDGVVSAAIATMYENGKDRDVIYIPYSYEDDVKKVTSKVRDLDVVYVLDVSFGADSKTIFKDWLDEGKSLMWIDHHKGIIEDSKTWGFVVPGLRRVGVGASALASDLLMGKVPAIVRCLSDYDVWNKESGLGWDTVVAVQYALRSKIRLNVLIALSYLYDHFKENMKDNEIDLIFYDLAKEGRAIINYMAGKNEQEVSAYSFEAYVDEVKVVAMNTTEFSSKVFDSLTPDWLDGRKIKALMPFCIMPSGKVRFSLYECVEDSADCCEVSKRFGGGGHAGAAGFVIDVSSDQFKDFLENHKLTSIR